MVYHLMFSVSIESMAKFLGDLKLVYSISIVKPTQVNRGVVIQDFVNLTYDYYLFKFFKLDGM